MHHAVTTLLVATLLAVVLPARVLHQVLEALGVAFLQEVAGALPAEHVEGRIAPGRALVVVLTHQESQEQRRLVEPPAPLRIREHRDEEVVRPALPQEVLLVGGLPVAVAGGQHHALDAEVHHRVEELSHPERRGAVEQRRIGGQAEAALQGFPDSRHRLIVDSVTAYRAVVLWAQPVHVYADAQVPRGRQQPSLELLLQEERVRAEIHVLFARDEFRHERADVRVHERLAAGNADDGGAALLDRLQALLHGQVFLEDLGRILDLAAAGAGEVAAEKRLEHQHQWVALSAFKPLL